MLHISKLFFSATLATAILFSQPAAAEAPRQGEIVVTAQKREQSLQDVSVSVTAVSGDMLVDSGINDVSRLDVMVPGLVFQQSGNDVRFSMRGAVTAQVEANDVSVAFYTDGLYRPRHAQALAGFIDVERVEVLRGPQGTLFGRNSYGGAINVISKKPEFEAFDYGGAFGLGSYDHLRGEGFVNMPLGQNAALRVTGVREIRDPVVQNITVGDRGGLKDANNYYVRGQLAYDLNDDLSMLFRAEHWQDNANGNGDFGYKPLGVPVNRATGLTDGLAGVLNGFIGRRTDCVGRPSACGRAGAGLNAAAERVLADPYKISNDFSPLRDIEENTVAGEFTWRGLAFADVKLNLGYIDFKELRLADADLSSYASLIAGNAITSATTSQEIQLTSTHDGPLEWVAGLYFLQEDLSNAFLWMDIHSLVNNAPDPSVAPSYTWAPWLRQIRIDTRSHAAYTQGTWSLRDSLRLIGGLRYTYDTREWYVSRPQGAVNGAFAGDTSALRFNTPAPGGGGKSWNQLTWKAGLEWDLNADAMSYFTASTGFLSGNVQGAFAAPRSYDERRVKAYEIGLKSTLLEGALRFNVAAYYNTYENLLATRFVPVGSTVLAQSDNAGASDALGLEIEADWMPIERLNLGLRAAFTRARYDRFIVTNQFRGGGQTIGGVGGLIRRDGGQVWGSPDLTLTLLGGYDFSLGEYGALTPGFSFYYSDDYIAFDRPYTFARQDSYTRTDLSLNWASTDGDWNAQAFVHNLEDEAVLLNATVFGGNLAVGSYAMPRTFGFRVGYRF